MRPCRVLLQIEDQDRNRLNGVAGSLKDLQAQPRELKGVAVLHGEEGVLRLGARAEMDGCAATIAQLQVAGNEVGVEVAEKDMPDFEAEFFGVGQVLLDVALRVDDDGGRTGLVSEQIGGVGEAAQVVLFQNHGSIGSLAPALQVAGERSTSAGGRSADKVGAPSSRRDTFSGRRHLRRCR